MDKFDCIYIYFDRQNNYNEVIIINNRQKKILTYMMPDCSPIDYIYETDGTTTLLYYLKNLKQVNVPKKVDGTVVSKIEITTFFGKDMNKVTIPDGITEVM